MLKSKLLKGLIISLGMMTISYQGANAQGTTQPQPFQSNEKNPLYGNGINPMELIHNANFLNGRSSTEFAEDTDKNLNSAAKDFKEQQRQRMMEMQKQSSPSSPPRSPDINPPAP